VEGEKGVGAKQNLVRRWINLIGSFQYLQAEGC